MEHASPTDVTVLLQGWRDGDRKALDALLPLVYKELRRLTLNTYSHVLPALQADAAVKMNAILTR